MSFTGLLVYSFTERETKLKMFLGMPALLHKVARPPQLLKRGSSGDEISPLCTSSLLWQDGSGNTEGASVMFWHLCDCGISSKGNNSTSVEPVNAKYLQMGTVWGKQQGKRCHLFYKLSLHCWSSLERKQHIEYQLFNKPPQRSPRQETEQGKIHMQQTLALFFAQGKNLMLRWWTH